MGKDSSGYFWDDWNLGQDIGSHKVLMHSFQHTADILNVSKAQWKGDWKDRGGWVIGTAGRNSLNDRISQALLGASPEEKEEDQNKESADVLLDLFDKRLGTKIQVRFPKARSLQHAPPNTLVDWHVSIKCTRTNFTSKDPPLVVPIVGTPVKWNTSRGTPPPLPSYEKIKRISTRGIPLTGSCTNIMFLNKKACLDAGEKWTEGRHGPPSIKMDDGASNELSDRNMPDYKIKAPPFRTSCPPDDSNPCSGPDHGVCDWSTGTCNCKELWSGVACNAYEAPKGKQLFKLRTVEQKLDGAALSKAATWANKIFAPISPNDPLRKPVNIEAFLNGGSESSDSDSDDDTDDENGGNSDDDDEQEDDGGDVLAIPTGR